MDEKKWQEYQDKLAEVRARFAKQRWKSRFWWGLYNVVVDVLLFAVVAGYTSVPLCLALCLASTILSTMELHMVNKKWVALQLKQEQEIMEKAPVGRIRLYE